MFEGRQKQKLEQKLKQEVKRRLKKRMKQKKLKLQNEFGGRKKLTQQKVSDFFPRTERAVGATPTATHPAPRNTAQKPDVKVQLHSTGCAIRVARLSDSDAGDEEQQLPVAQPQKPDDVDVKDTKHDVEDTKPDVSVKERCDKKDVKDQKPDVEDTKPDVSVKERCDEKEKKKHDDDAKDQKPDVENVEGNNKKIIIRRVKKKIYDYVPRQRKRSRLVIDYDGDPPTGVDEPLVNPLTQRHANSAKRIRAMQHAMQQHDFQRILRGASRHVKRDMQEGLYVLEARGANTRRAVDVRSQTVADPVPSKKDPNPTYPCQCCMSTMTWTKAEVSRRRLGYQEEYIKFLRAAGNLNNVPGKGLNF